MQPAPQLSLYDLAGYRIALIRYCRVQAILGAVILIALTPPLLGNIVSWFRGDATVLVISVVVIALTTLIAIRNVLEWKSKQFCRHCGTPISHSFRKHVDGWCRSCEWLSDTSQVCGPVLGELRLTHEIMSRQRCYEPVASLASQLILIAISQGASELTIDWFPLRVRIRYVANGVRLGTPLPYHLGRPLVQVFKAIALLDFHREDETQSGTVRLKVGQTTATMNIIVQPTRWGERVLMRFEPAEDLPRVTEQAAKVFNQLYDWSPHEEHRQSEGADEL